MNIRDLISSLEALVSHGLPETAIVKAFNGDSEQLEAVTGFLYDNATVEICTDEN